MDLRFKSITCTFFFLLCFRILSTMQDLLFFLSHPHSVTLLPQVLCAGSHILCSFHFSSHFTPASAILLPLYPSTVCWEYIVYFYISISISVYLYYIFLYNLTSLHSPPHGSLCTLFAPHAMSISCHLTRVFPIYRCLFPCLHFRKASGWLLFSCWLVLNKSMQISADCLITD